MLADGQVTPCCYARRELGNLKDASLEEIWNGPVAVELRAFIKRNEVHPVCDGAICKFVQNMQKSEAGPGMLRHSRMHGENLQAEIERLRSEYAAIKASTSWRITAPLRALSSTLNSRPI